MICWCSWCRQAFEITWERFGVAAQWDAGWGNRKGDVVCAVDEILTQAWTYWFTSTLNVCLSGTKPKSPRAGLAASRLEGGRWGPDVSVQEFSQLDSQVIFRFHDYECHVSVMASITFAGHVWNLGWPSLRGCVVWSLGLWRRWTHQISLPPPGACMNKRGMVKGGWVEEMCISHTLGCFL